MANNFPRGSAIYVFLVYEVNSPPPPPPPRPKKRIQGSLEIQDFTPWISDSRYWIPDSLSVDLGLRILIVSRIPDSLGCIPDSKAQDFGFQKQKFPGFWNPDLLTWAETTWAKQF